MKNNNLELGKAGEHFALYELIKQGYVAFLSDQGLPYDILVDINGSILRGQVKSTHGHSNYGKSTNCLRFGTRSGKGATRAARSDACDFYAFVSIHDKTASFFCVSELLSNKNEGGIKQTIDLRCRGGVPKSGRGSKMLIAEDYVMFSRVVEVISDGRINHGNELEETK